MTVIQPTVLTVPEVARTMRISRTTAYRLVENGTIPSVRLGRSVRVPARWLNQQLGGTDATHEG
jgi:excisionase family DNA binding protein